MNKLSRLLIILVTCFCSALSAEQTNKTLNSSTFAAHQFDAAECIAFYRYGHALTKRNKHSQNISKKFETLNKFLRKQLKLDVGEKSVDEIRKIGRANFKGYMEGNDGKYDVKVDSYNSELLELFKRYNVQCQTVIHHYQTTK